MIDSGIGVPKALQHHLFTKFHRAPNARHARPDGTGLGLFMAKKAIIAQGGFDINRVRIVVGEKTLIGAVVMGDQTLSTPLQKIIARKIDISSMREKLLARDAKIADVVVDFWSQHVTTS